MITYTSFMELLEKFGQPAQVYTGQETGCRCGCHGKYWQRGTQGYTRGLNRIMRSNPRVVIFQEEKELEDWMNTSGVRADGYVKPGLCYGLMKISPTCSPAEWIGDGWVDFVLEDKEDRTVTVYFEP